jgi:hypothetical protein
VLPIQPSVVPVLVTVSAPVVGMVLSAHTEASETLPEVRTRKCIIEVNCCLGES